MAPRTLAAAGLLLLSVALVGAHPRLRSLDVGALQEFPADQWVMGTEDLKYDRFLTAINNGLSNYAGPPELSRTVKMEAYFPPVALATPMQMPGWKVDMYPCESKGALQCDGWSVVSWTALSWDAAYNNTYMYNFPIGIRLKNDCKCNTPLVCEVVEGESVPGVEAGEEPQYLLWIPSIQYTSDNTNATATEGPSDPRLTPTYAVFWTHNWDVMKGVKDNVRADALLNFTDHELYSKDGPVPGYVNGRRAIKAKIADWSNCDYMEFNGKRIAVPEPEVAAITSPSGMLNRAIAAAAPDAAPAADNSLVVAALAIAVVSLVVAIGALVYAHMKVGAVPKAAAPPTMDGAAAPLKV